MLRSMLMFVLFLTVIVGNLYGETKVNQNEYQTGAFPVLKESPDGSIYLGYYANDRGLYIKNITDKGRETKLQTETEQGTFIDISFLKEGMAVVWRPKLGDGSKYVYVNRSVDSGKTFLPPSIINSEKDALMPMAVASDGKEVLYAIWTDERVKGEKSHGTNSLYMNYSTDSAKTFQKKDINITPDFEAVAHPAIKITGQRIDIFFIGRKPPMPSSFYHKYSTDRGATWSENIKLKELGDWMPGILKPVVFEDGTMSLLWAGVVGIEGIYSVDGKEWKDLSFTYTKDKDVNRMELVTRGKNVFMAVSWRNRGDLWSNRATVYFLRSKDGGATWSEPMRLNRNEFDSTTSWFPAIDASLDGKKVVVAWQDHRNIRGNIYINYSEDGGDSWLKEDIHIEKSMSNNSWFPQVYVINGKFYILWIRYAGDVIGGNSDLYLHEVKLDKAAYIKKEEKPLGLEEKERLLKERIKMMWKAQAEGNKKDMHDLYDPFFRARVGKDDFAGNKLAAKYYNPEIASVDIKGNVAQVKVKVEYELSSMIAGKPVQEPKKEVVTNETWLFIDGTWYRQHFDYISESSFALY